MDRDFIAKTAHMDGERAIAKSLGKKKKLSEMELIVLCTWAKIGLYGYFAEEVAGDMGERSAEHRREILAEVRSAFSTPEYDGLNKLSQTCAAMVCDGPLARYVCE